MKQIYVLSSHPNGAGDGTDYSLGVGVTKQADAARFAADSPPGQTRSFKLVEVYDNLEHALASRDPRTVIQLPTILGGVPVSSELDVPVQLAMNSKPFRDWEASMNRDYFKISRVHIQAVDLFAGGRVGFIKFVADIVDPQGGFVPGATFMRGGAVGMLPVFVCGGRYYTALTVQPRSPTGQSDFVELPAGMLDGDGNFAGVAAKELKEELGLTFSEKDLTDVSALAGNKGTFLSPGGSDEVLRHFGVKMNVERPWLKQMNGKCTGVIAEGEKITVKMALMSSIWRLPDAKTVAAYTYFRQVGHQIKLVPFR